MRTDMFSYCFYGIASSHVEDMHTYIRPAAQLQGYTGRPNRVQVKRATLRDKQLEIKYLSQVAGFVIEFCS